MTNATAQRTVSSSTGGAWSSSGGGPALAVPHQGGSRASLQPEKRLMLAVMEDAVGTFQKYRRARDRAGQRFSGKSREWFRVGRHRLALLVRQHLPIPQAGCQFSCATVAAMEAAAPRRTGRGVRSFRFPFRRETALGTPSQGAHPAPSHA